MRRNKPHTGIYLLPNLFTTASLFAAFYAIVAALKMQYETAVIAILVGTLSDGLDGRIARMTNTESDFGAEYDSLSDMVTFGVAPAILLYSWRLSTLGKLGWLIAFMYTAAVALRLARFNTQADRADKRYFQGLACTPAAATMASFVWFFHDAAIKNSFITSFAAILTVILAILMVSNIRFYSFKQFDFKGKIPFLYVLIMVILFVAIAANPSLVLFLTFVCYAASGPLQTLMALHQMRKQRRAVKLK